MACHDPACDFKPLKMQRRPVGDFDVLLDMKYCGVCHSDLHIAANHLKGVSPTEYPCVPGHELAGVCIQVGSKVSKVKVGDHVGVGCMLDSCKNCSNCKKGEEQKCSKQVGTYNGKDYHGRATSHPPGRSTLGGYTSKFVVHEDFAILIPKDYPLEAAGPVMCAGITMYDPMRCYGVKEGHNVGIIGLGGLGQMGIRVAKALGAKVTAISRSSGKEAFAKECGADDFIVSSSAEDMKKHEGALDLILNTIPVYHDYCQYNMLSKKKGGKHVLLGLHAGLAGAMLANSMTFGGSRLMHSGIGGIPATQEVMDLCAKHKIMLKTEIVPCKDINKVYEALDSNNDGGVRYVLDIEKTLNEKTEEECTLPPPNLHAPDSSGLLSPGGALKEAMWILFTGKWL